MVIKVRGMNNNDVMVESSTPNFQPSDSNNVDYQKGGGYQYIT
jgi:hypothetical protein